MALSNEDRQSLREFLEQHFSLEELKTLSFDLAISCEEFPNSTISAFSRELILYCERIYLIPCLLFQVVRARPNSSISNMLTKVGPCRPRIKVQVIFNDSVLKMTEEQFKLMIAQAYFNISPDQVQIIASAPGSIRILIGLPKRITPPTLFLGRILPISVLNVSVFEQISRESQTKWRHTYIQGNAHLHQLFQSSSHSESSVDIYRSPHNAH